MCVFFLTEAAKVYIGERVASLLNGAGENGYISEEQSKMQPL